MTKVKQRRPKTGGTIMKLTQQQIDDFNREGWLFLPELFSPEEVAYLAREAVSIYDANRPEVWRGKRGAPRTRLSAPPFHERIGGPRRPSPLIHPDDQNFCREGSHHPIQMPA